MAKNHVKKTIELVVDGKVVGTASITIDNRTHNSQVSGEGLLYHGKYLMTPEELKEMIYRRAERDLGAGNFELRVNNPQEEKSEYPKERSIWDYITAPFRKKAHYQQ